MREKLGICVFIWFVLHESCVGRFVVEKNSLKVTSPGSLRDVYECAIGNFGVPQYGGTMVGTVIYPKSNQRGCKGFDHSFKSNPGGLPVFLLADRGGGTEKVNNKIETPECYFTLKAWNAQNAGAAAILVADDRVEPLITMDTPEEEDARSDYLQKISIPAALISISLGNNIKKALSNGEMVNINLDWRESVPHPDDQVEYEFWTNSNDECGPKCDSQIAFVKSFKGIDVKQIDKCIGDPDADVDNQVLKSEQEAQIGRGSRGDVTILPTLVVNNRQYRGKLDKSAVLKAICSGFQETTEPAICLSADIETNECLQNNGGCWQDKASNITACRDTFRGRVCECPIVQGVKFFGDGYTHCEASGALRCGLNNGGCWKKTQEGRTYSACIDDHSKGCKCPPGFRGDGVNTCEDIDECKEKLACQCSQCKCKNTWGSYDCRCGGSNLLYMREHDTCISKDANREVGWGFIWVIILGLAAAGLGGYAVYKYRIRSYMDSEIRAIMAQYMPLDNQAELPNNPAPYAYA
ncbi:hypothetical protein RHMOL_Rhmol04G0179900 [Rhododendron molle]|uniref:Uncharacterized protein n=1 Tax=Rhododendron molle TaxID=49168 RepID=A0ACC0P1P2_RHOML|nr:hypothetical protein RHMOL_Rhmol04G0179900 [Rhododendron molle]